MYYKDLTGKQYGRLTVIEVVSCEAGKYRWRCRCACGNEVIVAGGNLPSGNTTSCGCYRREQIAAAGKQRRGVFADLTGQRFGRLLVMSFAGTLNGKPFWNCLCDCGAMRIVMAQSLRGHKTVSCGCYRRMLVARPKKLRPGTRFGRLVTQHYDMTTRAWECLCDCGTVIQTRTSSLLNGHTVSCGCYQREQLAARAATHGLSATRGYIAFKARERLERKRTLDRAWTLPMEFVLREQQPACIICGTTEDLTTDHVRPLSKGHGLRPGNAVRLCGSCNSTKSNKDLAQLPPEWQTKIAAAAETFKQDWEHTHGTV